MTELCINKTDNATHTSNITELPRLSNEWKETQMICILGESNRLSLEKSHSSAILEYRELKFYLFLPVKQISPSTSNLKSLFHSNPPTKGFYDPSLAATWNSPFILNWRCNKIKGAVCVNAQLKHSKLVLKHTSENTEKKKKNNTES